MSSKMEGYAIWISSTSTVEREKPARLRREVTDWESGVDAAGRGRKGWFGYGS